MTVLQTRWNSNQLFFIVSILLLEGAAKGNATMIKAYLILNGIVILIILAGRVLAFSGVVKVGAGGVSNAQGSVTHSDPEQYTHSLKIGT